MEFNVNDFNEIKQFMQDSNDLQVETFYNPIFNTIWFRDIIEFNTELYLKSIKDKLIISRISFKNTHQGVGTKVLQLLKEYARKNNYKSIVIESTLTKEMNQFCRKYNFKPVTYQCHEYNGDLYGNYELVLGEE